MIDALARLREVLAGYSGPVTVVVRNGMPVMLRAQQGEMPLVGYEALKDKILDLRWGEVEVQFSRGEPVKQCKAEKQVKLGQWVE